MWNRPVRAIGLFCAVLILVACNDLGVGLMLDESTRQHMDREAVAERLQAASEADAIALVRASPDPATHSIAAVVGLWDNRPALLSAALAQGVNPNVGMPIETVAAYPIDVSRPFPTLMYSALGGIRHSDSTTRTLVEPRLMARTLASLNALIAAGAQYDQATLDEALAAAVIFGQEIALAEQLRGMGARFTPPSANTQWSLIHKAAEYATPALLEWGLQNGLDANSRFSVGRPGVAVNAGSNDIPIYNYHLGFTPLHVVSGPLSSPAAQRTVDAAKVLVAAGADVQARSIFSNSAGTDRPMQGWTPLHAAYLHAELFTFLYAELKDPSINPLAAYLIGVGANPLAQTNTGEKPQQIYGLQARRGAQYSQLAEQRQRARDRQSQPSGDGFGQMLAAAGMVAVTGAAIGSGMDSAAAAQIGGAGLADIFSNGQNNALGNTAGTLQNRSTAAQSPQQQSVGSTAGPQTESYALQCPSGVTNTIPLSYRTQQCRSAMIAYAQAYACNDFNSFESVQTNCQAACGSPSCEQR